jgi:uncharacterized membrane protein YdjX (TVP38/TMEM64 family)
MRIALPIIHVLLWLLSAVGLAFARLSPPVQHAILVISSDLTVGRLRAVIASWGPWAPLLSIALMVLQTFLPFPADPLIIANGIAFGVWEGLAVSVVGAVLSGGVAFGLGRRLGRPAALRFVPAHVVEWVDSVAARRSWTAVLTVQFLPLIPFSLLNFLLGLTSLSWATFLWTLAASILPADLLLVLLGRGIGDGRSSVYWTLAALVLLVAATVPIRRWFARAWGTPEPPRRPTRARG